MSYASNPKFNQASSTYNFSATSLRKARNAIARAAAGGNNAKIVLHGDSITAGRGATDLAHSYPSQLRTLLATRLPDRGGMVPAYMFTNSPLIANSPGPYDPAYVLSTSPAWAAFQGGGFFKNFAYSPSNAGATLTVTATTDQFIVYYEKYSAGGTPTVTLDGVAQGSIPSSAGTGYGSFTITPASQGSHTLVITGPTSGSAVWACLGVTARVGGSTGGVVVDRVACGGQTYTNLVESTTGTTGSSLNTSFDMLAPDLSIMMFGTNEAQASVSATTFASDAQAAITRAKLTGDVILVVPPPPNAGVTSFNSYIPKLYALADSNDVGLIDLSARWGAYPASTALMTDGLHPNDAGYRDLAQTVYAALQTLGLGL